LKYFEVKSQDFQDSYARAQKGSLAAMRVVAESLLQAGMESSRSQTQDKIFDEALHWLELAAESGDLEAMKRLVRCRDGSLHYKLSTDQ